MSIQNEDLIKENQLLREALMKIAFGDPFNMFAGNPFLWPETIAYLALGGRMEAGVRLDTKEDLDGNV